MGSQMKHWIEWTRTDLTDEEVGEFYIDLTGATTRIQPDSQEA
jgi:hypothetical protein